jgi:hypothetical protein
MRLNEALNHPSAKWRSLARVAAEAGVSEEIAADRLRADPRVRFSNNEKGKIIVGLRDRVGNVSSISKKSPSKQKP